MLHFFNKKARDFSPALGAEMALIIKSCSILFLKILKPESRGTFATSLINSGKSGLSESYFSNLFLYVSYLTSFKSLGVP